MAGIEAFFETDDDDETVIIDDNSDTEVTPDADTTDVSDEIADDESGAEDTVDEEVTEEDDQSATDTSDTETIEPTDFELAERRHQQEVSSLRQMLREQGETIKELKGQSDRVVSTLTESGHIDESDLEPQEEESGSVSDAKAESLSLLAETMRVNPTYSDLDEVCSAENFNLVVDALAKMAVEEDGGTLTEQMQEVTDYIWGMPNPYKFVYDLVKEHHPKYQTPPDEAAPDTSGGKKGAKPTPPSSVSSVPGGGGASNSGWTAAKIDSLPEEELHKVPAAVYDKYMRNDLK